MRIVGNFANHKIQKKLHCATVSCTESQDIVQFDYGTHSSLTRIKLNNHLILR